MSNIRYEISELDPKEKVNMASVRRIIMNGLRPEYSGFTATVRGWLKYPSLLELENLSAN